MHSRSQKKGFTLIEMLVVIAIIAILVSIVIPVVSKSITKAKAAVDAANMRNSLGQANVLLVSDRTANEAAAETMSSFACASFEGASLKILFRDPGFIDVYFVDGSSYYSIAYFAELAQTGDKSKATVSTACPTDEDIVWFTPGN